MRRWIALICLLVCTAWAAAGCGKGYIDLPPMQFHSLITSNKKIRIVDVRTPEEYRAEHIRGALNMPVSDTAAFVAAMDSLRKKMPVAVYCRSGVRGQRASRILSHRGYVVYHLRGGMLAWKERGLPTRGEGESKNRDLQ